MESAGSEAGFTLVEMMVVTMLLGIVLMIVSSALISVQDTESTADSRSQTIDQVRLAEQQLAYQIRSANYVYDPSGEYNSSASPPVANAGPACTQSLTTNCVPQSSSGSGGFSLRLFSQTYGTYQCVQWRVWTTASGGMLEFRSWNPAWQSNGEVTSWEPVAYDIVNPTTNPPFKLDSGSQFGGRLVDIDVFANQNPTQAARVANVEDKTSVAGRDVEFGYSSAVCNSIPSP